MTGVLGYSFHDRRTGRGRLVDYKLPPGDDPASDLFQVCVYALAHHVQHGSEPGAAVLYLHPYRQVIEKSWEQVHAERHLVYNLLASLREWAAYEEVSRRGLKPPGEPAYCDVCRWNKQCMKRLGPKHEGRRLIANWSGFSPGAAAARRQDRSLFTGQPC